MNIERDNSMQLRRLATLLSRFRYRYSHETQLHEALAEVLNQAGYAFNREHALDANNRADFYLIGGLVIEVKVDGSLSGALQQVARYSKLEEVTGVLLAGATAWAAAPIDAGRYLNGKSFEVVHLQRRFL